MRTQKVPTPSLVHSLCTLSSQCWISSPLHLQKGILFEVRPCQGAMKSKWACHSLWVTVPQLPHSQEEKAKTLTPKGKTPRTWSLPSRDSSYEKINFCYFKLIILWLFLLWQTQQKKYILLWIKFDGGSGIFWEQKASLCVLVGFEPLWRYLTDNFREKIVLWLMA